MGKCKRCGSNTKGTFTLCYSCSEKHKKNKVTSMTGIDAKSVQRAYLPTEHIADHTIKNMF